MKEYEKLSWGYMANNHNFANRSYGKGRMYNFSSHWSNGWISEMNPSKGLFVASAWFTPDKKIVHKINTDKACLWIFCVDCVEIIYMQQGKPAQRLSPITHMIINPQKPFNFTFSRDEHYCFTSVLVYDEYIQSFIKNREDAPKIGVEDAKLWETQHLNTPNIMLILEQIRWAVRNSDIPLLAYEGMVLHLLSSIVRNFPEIPKRRASRRNYVTWENEKKIYTVKELIDRDILNIPSINELCEVAEMSESRLREAFKNTYGIPLYKYIRAEIIKRGMQLLSADHLSIRDISERCGYKNASKFSAAFKEVHGITPSEFRKSFNIFESFTPHDCYLLFLVIGSDIMERLLDFLNKLEQAHIYYKLSKYRPEYIMVEIAVPGERWEVEFSVNDIYIEKFITDNGNYRESELEVLLRDFSD